MSRDFNGGGVHRQFGFRGKFSILSVLVFVLTYFLPFCYAIAADSPVQTIWFYKPPLSGGTLQTVANNFDRAILTRGDEDERIELQSFGMNEPYLVYVRGDTIHAPCGGSCPCADKPAYNQIAWNIGDYCDILANHSDWFLRDDAGALITIPQYGIDRIYMDPANAGWRSFFLDRVSQFHVVSGWDGVYMDNIDTSLNRFNRSGINLQKYPDHISWQNAVSGFLAYLYSNYFNPANVPLSANITEMGGQGHIWSAYIENLDAGFHESFGVDWEDGYRSVDRWEEDLDRVDQSVAMGKRVFLVSQGAKNALNRQKFALASYLLVSHDDVYFRYNDSSAYRAIWLYNNYDVELGDPLGSRQFVGGAWRREFTNGYVQVDPANQTAEIVVDNTQPPVSPPPTNTQGGSKPMPWLWLLLE